VVQAFWVEVNEKVCAPSPALCKVIEESGVQQPPFKLAKASVKGKGLQSAVSQLSPAAMIAYSYERDHT
jgi:hypothetical protein